MFWFLKKGTNENKNSTSKVELDKSLKRNIDKVHQLFSEDINADFISRSVENKNSGLKGQLFFYQSITDVKRLEREVIKPLLENKMERIESNLYIDSLKKIDDFDELVDSVNSGKVILLVDDQEYGLELDLTNYEHRAIEKAENENLVKGPKEAFTESLSTNLSLIRKNIHDKDLISEKVILGERSKNALDILYIKDLVNEDILQNVKDRISTIKDDNVRNLELLEQHIEDNPNSIMPTILYTERPDRASWYLEDGYIVLLMDNSSACLILPVTFWAFLQNPEDYYLRFMFGNFSRIIRLISFFITIFVSAIYVAVTNYHSEMIPPDLLFAIAASRERVPFPIFFEILMMELAFEIIREAGLRIPSPLGPTIGIVGALILGQAAVEANIVSPIVVIIVALSGLSSFALSDVSINYAMRISRFLFIVSAAVFGFFGLCGAFLLWTIYLTSIRSFGVPYLAILPISKRSSKGTMFRRSVKSEKWRPLYLNPKDSTKK
ncbi:spore germination protein [Bacillaceae bacterium S4-13-56]